MRLLRRIAGNARYFTDSATKVPWDVESGDAAEGMCIDFYGRYQSESVRRPDGVSRMGYVTPAGGSSTGTDPIGMMRGAPSPDLAREFIEFVISPEGQKLWNWKVGAPGGPQKYALRRLPILPELYDAKYAAFRSDPEVNPYAAANGPDAFVYHPEWTGALFRTISFTVQVMCIDPHDELRDAWSALVAANFPPQATALFDDTSAIGYDVATSTIKPKLSSPNKIDQVRLAKEFCDRFRAQYIQVAKLAREGK
jgi:ABC-type glycerol-3-phosphate transport system substrate-binding protein